jgi:hypothetical protein
MLGQITASATIAGNILRVIDVTEFKQLDLLRELHHEQSDLRRSPLSTPLKPAATLSQLNSRARSHNNLRRSSQGEELGSNFPPVIRREFGA